MATPIDQYIGSHANNAAADAYIAARGWPVQEGWLYYDSTNVVLKIWDGAEWVGIWLSPTGPITANS